MRKLKIIDIGKATITVSLPKPLNDGDIINMTFKDGVPVSVSHDRLISEWRKRRGRG